MGQPGGSGGRGGVGLGCHRRCHGSWWGCEVSHGGGGHRGAAERRALDGERRGAGLIQQDSPGVVSRVVHVHVHVQVWLRGVVGQSVSRTVSGGLGWSGSSQQGGLVEGHLREAGWEGGEGGVGCRGRQA